MLDQNGNTFGIIGENGDGGPRFLDLVVEDPVVPTKTMEENGDVHI